MGRMGLLREVREAHEQRYSSVHGDSRTAGKPIKADVQ
ncbi:hypothetical protein FORC066_3323 [Yersinia enterocolitica]|nr:hypothetical protein FORC066_3323 [Yersinia enterocolitica]